ncbi:hypothetical protein NKI77_29775 [Mesorhizobium opportunistum]|uniref:hypothetical protein n=1 Tax=Mesorhizobium opportunistum TaxID=593909 RepID=UPI0033396365
MIGGLLASTSEYLRSREFIERLTATRLVARQAMHEGRQLSGSELAAHLDLDEPVAQLLFNFLDAWDISEAAIADLAAHLAPAKQGEVRH